MKANRASTTAAGIALARAIESFLQQRGFGQVRNVDHEYLKQTYFTGVNQHRAVAMRYAIVSATVQPHASKAT